MCFVFLAVHDVCSEKHGTLDKKKMYVRGQRRKNIFISSRGVWRTYNKNSRTENFVQRPLNTPGPICFCSKLTIFTYNSSSFSLTHTYTYAKQMDRSQWTPRGRFLNTHFYHLLILLETKESEVTRKKETWIEWRKKKNALKFENFKFLPTFFFLTFFLSALERQQIRRG